MVAFVVTIAVIIVIMESVVYSGDDPIFFNIFVDRMFLRFFICCE